MKRSIHARLAVCKIATVALLIGTQAHAAILSEETFTYPDGTLDGQNGGTGFTTAWGSANGNGGSPANAFSVLNGQAVYGGPHSNAVIFRGLSTTFPSSGVLWLAVDYQRVGNSDFAGIQIFAGTSERLLVGSAFAAGTWTLGRDGSTTAVFSSVAANTIKRGVVRLTFGAGANGVADLWVGIGQQAVDVSGPPAATLSGASLTGVDTLRIGSNDMQIIDNFRLGQTAADVNPFVVNSTADADDGVCDPLGTGNGCTLREAINAANSATDGTAIQFDIPASDSGCDANGVCTIQPASSLPSITKSGTTIDGYTQTGAAVNSNSTGALNTVLKIVLSGPNQPGLGIDASNCTVRGLVINGFNSGGAGIIIGATVTGVSGNAITGNFIGTNVAGTGAVANSFGVNIQANSTANRVGTDGDGTNDAAERNLISGNDTVGILLQGATTNNVIGGNLIGTNAAGDVSGSGPPVPNGISVLVDQGAANNVIGTDGIGTSAAAKGNVISGNGGKGVQLDGAGVTGNVVAGNLIGTDSTGTAADGNGFGVLISGGASNNRIGTNGDGVGDVAERNVISANSRGIQIQDIGTSGNVVAGNYIGLDVAGTDNGLMGNSNGGVIIDIGASNNLIGTNGDGSGDAAERNVIGGRGQSVGINIRDSSFTTGNGPTGNIVAGNFIGTEADGTTAVQNSRGIVIQGGASNNRIGTNADGVNDAAERNVISGSIK